MNLATKYGEVKIFTENIEEAALSQIIEMGNSILGENANVRIMPDAHAGSGCVIGTTLKITDKVCPNLVGVDIGCGVTLVKTDIDFKNNMDKLDEIIRDNIPFGKNVHDRTIEYPLFEDLLCWNKLTADTKSTAQCSLGTLGGGNHFIEAYEDGWLSVHSGSRNIGYRAAKYYQTVAERECIKKQTDIRKVALEKINPSDRESWLQSNKISVSKELTYLQDQSMLEYLHDIDILQKFANDNRHAMLKCIVDKFEGRILDEINSIHNYIDVNTMILRKGAISAELGEELVIPLNMRDGLLLCRGKGNEDWNRSAPHGAGRLYSRSKAKERFTLDEYVEAMQGIYSTCINESTLDEAPFAYKDYKEIMKNIEPTVEIEKRLVPIYNFKAN